MITEEKKQVLEFFSEGRKFYKLMDFANAKNCFEKALQIDSSDSPSRVYLERCDWYMKNPPAEDWDGVFTMTTK
ncbi:MAG TPA: tetratricopeptide repeat protein [Treponemataceae bacterium]|nr:tetratricopeptide repeat protein [Treponemataceae bacterium]